MTSWSIYVLGYLKDSNAAEHSVDSDIFYTQWFNYSSSLQDLRINLYFSKLCQIVTILSLDTSHLLQANQSKT